MNLRPHPIALALTAAMTGAVAQASSLPLSEAMATAREQAQEVLAAQARAVAGNARFNQTKAYRMPKVSFQEMWIRTNNPAEVFAFQLNQGRFSFEDFVTGDPNNPSYLNNATSRFLLEMPVYTGGEIAGRIDQARLASQAAAIEAIWVEDSAALAAAEAYIRLSQARENVALLEHVLDTVDSHVQIAQAYVDQGMLVRSELLRAQVERSRVEDLLIEARGRARVAQSNLAFRMGMDTSEDWDLQPLQDPQPLDQELPEWLTTAEDRADLEAARHLLQAAEIEIKVMRSGLFPKIGVAARYDMFSDQVFTADNESAAVMAMLSVDLFSGNRHRAAKAAAEADHLAGQQQIAQFTEGIRLEVRDAYERAVTAHERFQTASAAQAAAIEVERITEERFKQGVVKMIELVDATTALQEAQVRELVARAECHLASLALAAKAGRHPEEVLTNQSTTPTRNKS